MLLTRFNSIDYILNLELKEALEIIKIAIDEENEEKIFKRWLQYQDQMSFNEFKQRIGVKIEDKKINVEPKRQEEILSDVKNIIDSTIERG